MKKGKRKLQKALDGEVQELNNFENSSRDQYDTYLDNIYSGGYLGRPHSLVFRIVDPTAYEVGYNEFVSDNRARINERIADLEKELDALGA